MATPFPAPLSRPEAWLFARGGYSIDDLLGTEFERCLEAMFVRLGYQAERTETYDFGADLLLTKQGLRTAVQAKRQEGPVGERAVQQVLAGRVHYQCDGAQVVTNSELMPRARKLASECEVRVVERPELTRLLQLAGMVESPVLLDPPPCNRCGVRLVPRSGPFGPFWGCRNFPQGCHHRAPYRYSLVLRALQWSQISRPTAAAPPELVDRPGASSISVVELVRRRWWAPGARGRAAASNLVKRG
jgi:restriction system protein